MTDRARFEIASIALAKGWKVTARERHPTFLTFVIASPRGDGVFEIDPIDGGKDGEVIDLPTLKERVLRTIELYEAHVSQPFDCADWESSESPTIACHGYTIVWRDKQRPVIQRQWHLICGADTVVVSYKNMNGDDVAHDIFDCEEMVRSIRFEKQIS